MSLLKLNRGNEYSLPVELNDGWLYFCTDTGSVFIDHYDSTNTLVRSKVSAEHADKLRYVQSEEPIDAPDGALWIDLDAAHVSGLDTVTFPEATASNNGKFLRVVNGAWDVSDDVVLYTQQTLTEEQQEQVRENIGAAPAETTVSMKATASRTAYQISVTVNDVTAKTPAMSFVRYDGNQTGLTDAQKAQAQENIGAAAMIASSKLGDSISLTDSAAMKLQNLRLFGKTTQNGTPTPDAPVELVSAGDGGTVTAKVMGKNILNVDGMLKPGVLEKHGDEYVLTKTSDSRFSNYVDCFIPKNTYFQAHVNMLENTSVYNDLSMVIDFEDKTNSTIPISSSYRIYQKDITRCQLFLQSEDAVGALQRFKDFQIEYGTTATAYEPYKELQTLTISAPNGLPGIPVSSGGNYTDEMGQQWVCDEVDFSRGVYVQRVAVETFDGSADERWNDTASANAPYGIAPRNIANCTDTDTRIICNRYPTATIQESWSAKDYLVSRPGASASNICFRNVDITSLDAWVADVSANPITIQYVLASPIETALSAEELTAYAALHTNHPNTTILNDGGVGMEVCYTTDTKLYIDDQMSTMQPIFVPQELTEAQKTQARANIGAATVNDVLAALPTWTGGAY